MSGSRHVFDVAASQWSDGVLPGLNTPFPEVSVSAGWVAQDEFHADVVSRRTPHRLQLRARAGREPALAVSWLAPPLPL